MFISKKSKNILRHSLPKTVNVSTKHSSKEIKSKEETKTEVEEKHGAKKSKSRKALSAVEETPSEIVCAEKKNNEE